MSIFYHERELRRVARQLKVEIVQLSWEGHCRCDNVDFWPTSGQFWNRTTDERGKYEDLREMLAEQLTQG